MDHVENLAARYRVLMQLVARALRGEELAPELQHHLAHNACSSCLAPTVFPLAVPSQCPGCLQQGRVRPPEGAPLMYQGMPVAYVNGPPKGSVIAIHEKDLATLPEPLPPPRPVTLADPCPHPERNSRHEIYLDNDILFCRACGAREAKS